MVLPQSESFTLLKSRLKCVYYFNSMPQVSESARAQTQSPLNAELEAIYRKSNSG